MSAIRVELELNDSSFTSRMLHAGQSVQNLKDQVGGGITSIRSMERESSSLARSIGMMTVAIGTAAATVGMFKIAANGLIGDLVRVNAEFERLNQLLKGMSTAADPVKDAAAQVKYLRDFAMQTPYSLKGLTDVFVRLKSTGIDPMAGSLRNLTDAVAASGGTEEQLRRAALAISQMSGKGVIQMEELRQQLGEAIPRATEIMARSMGVTYNDLVQKISTGMVSAKPALEALRMEFERTFGGAAQQQMNTFNGLMNQARTRIQNLALAAGEAGFMDALKTQLRDLNDALSGNQANAMAQSFGGAMSSIVTGLRSGIDWIVKFRNEIAVFGETLLYVFGGAVALAVLGRFVTMVQLTSANVASLATAINALSVAQVANVATANRMIGVQTAMAARFAAVGSAVGVLGFTISRLVPQLAIIAIIGAGIAAYFDLFGSAAKKSDEQMRNFGASSEEALTEFNQRSIALRGEIGKLQAALAELERSTPQRLRGPIWNSRANDLRDQIGTKEVELQAREQLLSQRADEFERNKSEREAQSAARRLSDEESKVRRRYDIQRVEAAKAREQEEKDAARAGRSVQVVRQKAQQEERQAQLRFYDEIAKLYEDAMIAADERIKTAREKGQIDDVAERQKGIIAERILANRERQEAQRALAMGVPLQPKVANEDRLIEKATTQLERYRSELAGMQADLRGASSEGAKLAYELEKVRFKDGVENPAIRQLIDQILEAQAQYEKLDRLIKGRDKLLSDIQSEIRKLEDDTFERQNAGASAYEKLLNRVRRGDYEGYMVDAEGNIVRTQKALKELQEAAADPKAQQGLQGTRQAIVQAENAAKQAGNTFQAAFEQSGKTAVERFNEALGRTAGIIDQIRNGAAGLNVLQGFVGNGSPVGDFAMGRASSAASGDASRQAFEFFRSKDLNASAASGLVGNLLQESSLNPNARNKGDGRDGSDSIGISQWNSDRAENLKRFAASRGTAWNDFQTQLEFMWQELQGPENRALANLQRAGSVREGAMAAVGFFRPAGWKSSDASGSHGMGNRAANAEKVANIYGGAQIGPTVANAQRGFLPDAAQAQEHARVIVETNRTIAESEKERQAVSEQAKLKAAQESNNNARIADEYKRIARAAEEATDKYDGLGKREAELRERIKSGALGPNVNPNDSVYAGLFEQAKKLDDAEKKLADSRKRRAEADQAMKKSTESAREAARTNEDTQRRLANLGGRDPTEDQAAQLRRQGEERLRIIREQHGEESAEYRRAAEEQRQILDAEHNARASKRAQELAQENQTTARSLMNSTQAAQARLQQEIAILQQELAQSKATGEARVALEAQIAEKIRLLRQQAAASGPMAQAAQQWADIGKNMETAMVGWIDSGIDSIAEFAATGEFNFKKLAQSIIKDLTRIGLRFAMSQMMGNKGGGGLAGKGGAAAAPRAGMKMMGMPAKHTGGIVGGSLGMIRNVGMGVFAGAPRYHTGGIINDMVNHVAGTNLMPGEVPIIAKRGEGVFTPEQMAAMGGSNTSLSQSVVVNVNGGGSGDKKKDQELGDTVARAVERQLRGMVGSEIKQQLRPGGIIREAAR